MPQTNDPEVARDNRTAKERARDAELARLRDHPDEWMDEMIQRFFLETGKQLKLIEETKAREASEQERHARTLASLERTLERLQRLESARASRERKVAMSYEEARAEVERRLDKLLAGPRPEEGSR